MSEQPEAEVEETAVTEEAPATEQTEEKPANPLFDALFEAAEEEPEEQEQEAIAAPSSLSEALYDIENEEPVEAEEEAEEYRTCTHRRVAGIEGTVRPPPGLHGRVASATTVSSFYHCVLRRLRRGDLK